MSNTIFEGELDNAELELLEAAKLVLERIVEIYRPEYVTRAAAKDPGSLLGRTKRLEAAIAKVEKLAE